MLLHQLTEWLRDIIISSMTRNGSSDPSLEVTSFTA